MLADCVRLAAAHEAAEIATIRGPLRCCGIDCNVLGEARNVVHGALRGAPELPSLDRGRNSRQCRHRQVGVVIEHTFALEAAIQRRAENLEEVGIVARMILDEENASRTRRIVGEQRAARGIRVFCEPLRPEVAGLVVRVGGSQEYFHGRQLYWVAPPLRRHRNRKFTIQP